MGDFVMNNENMNQNNQQNQNGYQQPQYQQPQYQQPQYQPQQKPPRNPQDGRAFSITALVIGCISVALCWAPIMNIILLACGILAIIFGNKGRKMSIMAYGKPSGIATAGFILGILGTAIVGLGAVSCVACYACASCASCGSASMLNGLF